MSVFLTILTVVLIFVSLFLILVVLAQKSKDGGMGAALGGGAAEAAFGADTSNVLSKSTIWAAVLFFVLAFILFAGRIYEHKHAAVVAGSALPTINMPAAPATAPTTGTTAPSTGAPQVALPAANTAAPTTSTPATAPVTAPAQSMPAPAPKK
jgi:preprotein translocase subunit SecG